MKWDEMSGYSVYLFFAAIEKIHCKRTNEGMNELVCTGGSRCCICLHSRFGFVEFTRYIWRFFYQFYASWMMDKVGLEIECLMN